MVELQIVIDDEQILKDLQADSRGRVTLGSEYAGETVSLAVFEPKQNPSDTDEP